MNIEISNYLIKKAKSQTSTPNQFASWLANEYWQLTKYTKTEKKYLKFAESYALRKFWNLYNFSEIKETLELLKNYPNHYWKQNVNEKYMKKIIVNEKQARIIQEMGQNKDVDYTIDDQGIHFKVDKDTSTHLKFELVDSGYEVLEYEILGDMSGLLNNGGYLVAPEHIGAMTEAKIVLYDDKLYTDIAYYQIRSYVDDLIEKGEATLDYHSTLDDNQITQLMKNMGFDD